MTDDYPAQLRTELTRLRRQHVPFEQAWAEAYKPPAEWGGESMADFLRKHFRAAYNRDSSMKGRCLITETEASAAVRPLPRRFVKPEPDCCRSGDGCSRVPVRGRFGPTFCEQHGAELATMALVPYEDVAA